MNIQEIPDPLPIRQRRNCTSFNRRQHADRIGEIGEAARLARARFVLESARIGEPHSFDPSPFGAWRSQAFKMML